MPPAAAKLRMCTCSWYLLAAVCIAAARASNAVAAAERYLVHYHPSVKDKLLEHLTVQGLPVERHVESQNIVVVRAGSDIRASLLQNVGSVRVEVDPVRQLQAGRCVSGACADRPVAPQALEVFPYGLQLTHVLDPEFQAYAPNGTVDSDVTICILDSGYDAKTDDLKLNKVNGCYDGPNGKCPLDWQLEIYGHGTAVASVASAALNGKGTVGVIPNGAQLYVIRVVDEKGYRAAVYSSDLIAAWHSCEDFRKQQESLTGRTHRMVVSMSVAGLSHSEAERQALEEFEKAGNMIFVAAAGNSGNSSYYYPAAYPQVLSVGAVDCKGNISRVSTFNDQVDVVAPGVNVLTSADLVEGQPTEGFPGYESLLARLSFTEPLRNSSALLGYDVQPAWGAKPENVSGSLVQCATGVNALASKLSDAAGRPPSVACPGPGGHICLVEVGDAVRVGAAVKGCQQSGGVGVLVYNPHYPDDNLAVDADVTDEVSCAAGPGLFLPTASISTALAKVLRSYLPASPNASIPPMITLSLTENPVTVFPQTGTSFSVPFVSGIAARMWAAHPNCTAKDVHQAIVSTARDLGPEGRDNMYGTGLVHAADALWYLESLPCASKPPPKAPKRPAYKPQKRGPLPGTIPILDADLPGMFKDNTPLVPGILPQNLTTPGQNDTKPPSPSNTTAESPTLSDTASRGANPDPSGAAAAVSASDVPAPNTSKRTRQAGKSRQEKALVRLAVLTTVSFFLACVLLLVIHLVYRAHSRRIAPATVIVSRYSAEFKDDLEAKAVPHSMGNAAGGVNYEDGAVSILIDTSESINFTLNPMQPISASVLAQSAGLNRT